MVKDGEQLINAARKLDEEALTTIFDEFAPPIYKYVMRYSHDATLADNITGDTFAQLLEQFAIGKGPHTNLKSYLYQTAYHLGVDHVRKNQHNAPLELAVNISGKDAPSVQAEVENRSTMESLKDAMYSILSDDERHVIVLRFMEDFSLKETAQIIGKEADNVKVIQHRGLTKLRKALGEKIDDSNIDDGNNVFDSSDFRTSGFQTVT